MRRKTTEKRSKRAQSCKMIMNCRLKATKIKSQRKTLRRLRISSCLGKKTVDTGVLQTTKMITLKSFNLSEY